MFPVFVYGYFNCDSCEDLTISFETRYYVVTVVRKILCNSYTMGCPPVRGDNPRALASGLSYVQVDKNGITICITVDLTHHEILRAKVGKGGINSVDPAT